MTLFSSMALSNFRNGKEVWEVRTKKDIKKLGKSRKETKKIKFKILESFLAQWRTKNIYHMFQAGDDSSPFLSRDLTQLLI